MMYRAGIVGCGRIGCGCTGQKQQVISTHATAYTKFRKTDLIALADIDNKKLLECGKRFDVQNLYNDYNEMLSKENLDILSICTRNSVRFEIIEAATKRGVKAVLCEKPIANRLTTGRKIVGLCKKKNVLLAIDHQRRFDPFHQKIKALMDKGTIGEIQQASFYYVAGIGNTGSHVFDLLRFFWGDIDWVQAVYSENESPYPKDPNIDGMVKCKNGVLCSVQACGAKNFSIFQVNILGTTGAFRLTHSGFDLEFFEVRNSKHFLGFKELHRASVPVKRNPKTQFILNILKDMITNLETKAPVISSGEDGLKALEAICAFHESAKREGKRIYLPLRKNKIRIESK